MNVPDPKVENTAHSKTGGFSLIEIIIAIALLALVTGLFVTNMPGLTGGIGNRPLEDILQKSVRDARYQAALNKERVSLSFDAEQSAFLVLSEAGEILTSRESGYDSGDNISIAFEQLLPYEGLRNSGTQERVEIPLVHFHPDRSSTPFIATLNIENTRSEHRFDPFSDLEIKSEER